MYDVLRFLTIHKLTLLIDLLTIFLYDINTIQDEMQSIFSSIGKFLFGGRNYARVQNHSTDGGNGNYQRPPPAAACGTRQMPRCTFRKPLPCERRRIVRDVGYRKPKGGGATVNEQKEARPDVGASERAKEPGQASRRGRASNVQFTTPPPPPQAVKISGFLSTGEQNAIPLRHLRELVHLPARTVRLMIRQERLHGVPILESSSATGGYFLPGNDHERARCVRRLRKRAAEINRVADCVEGAAVIGK